MTKYRTSDTKPVDRHLSTALFATTGHVVAHVKTDGLGVPFIAKTVTGSRHFLRTPPGIAIDTAVLEQGKRAGCQYTEVKDKETGTVYRAKLATIDAHGFPVCRGFGHQTALAFAYWDEYDRNGRSLRLHLPDRPQATPSLFGGEAA